MCFTVPVCKSCDNCIIDILEFTAPSTSGKVKQFFVQSQNIVGRYFNVLIVLVDCGKDITVSINLFLTPIFWHCFLIH